MTEVKKHTYQLTAELKDFRPRIWRRFLIDANLPLSELGYALIVMFERTASHLFHFWHPNNYDLYYECACSEPADSLGFGAVHFKTIDARNVKISKVLPEVGKSLNFEYDFGDGWNFKIKLEKILDEKHGIEILRGAGYGIIEDCGGVGGLERIVELCNSRFGQEYEEFVAWSGLVECSRTLRACIFVWLSFRVLASYKKKPIMFAFALNIYCNIFRYDCQ